jgi:hypothetical protein
VGTVGAVEVDLVDAISFVGEALLTGSDGRGEADAAKFAMKRWRHSPVVLPAAGCAPHSEIGFRVCRWEEKVAVNLVPRAAGLPPLYIAQCDKGPPTM